MVFDVIPVFFGPFCLFFMFCEALWTAVESSQTVPVVSGRLGERGRGSAGMGAGVGVGARVAMFSRATRARPVTER